jgi:hypothetical protein
MAITGHDGFDFYNGTGAAPGYQSKWRVSLASSTQLVAGRLGGQALRLQSGAIYNPKTYNTRDLAAAATSVTVGFAFRIFSDGTMSDLTANTAVLYFCLGGDTTLQLGVGVNDDGSIFAIRPTSFSAGTTLGTSASGKILLNTWHYVEVEAVIDGSAGRVTVYVDNSQVLNLTGQNTKAMAGTGTDRITLYNSLLDTGGPHSMDFDDMYFKDDATKLGEQRCEVLLPTSDVAQGFARSTGTTNYTLVDDAPVVTTDYVQGSTVGDTDTYGLADLSSTPNSISSVMLVAYVQKTDAGTRTIALQAKSGATTSDGPDYAMTTSVTRLERMMLTDPNTSAAWTPSAVNALQAGPKVTL